MGEETGQVKLINVGVIVSDNQSWLCASLNGVLVKNSVVTRAVEIKCPILCEKQAVINISTICSQLYRI